MLHYSDLTPEQKKIICNGCGPKGNMVPVPDFLFTASCDQHDFHYWRGCTEADRFHADNEFLLAMIKDAGNDEALREIARFYFMAVRTWGWTCFHYADHQRDENDLPKNKS
jgi:hypothetical protein